MAFEFLDKFTYFTYIVFFIAILLEYLLNQKNGVYGLKDTLVNIVTGMFFLFVPFVIAGAIIGGLFAFFSPMSPFQMPAVWSSFITGEKTYWWAFVILILVDDFCFYWFHRILHISRFLWCIHEVHHSSSKYNFSVFLRASFLDFVPQGFFWIPVFLLGFKLEDILLQMSFSLFFQFFLHTKYTGKIYIIDLIFNTPSHHRVHHGKNIVYLDKNFGGIFIFWDILFKTFQRENEKVEYGILDEMKSYNFFTVNLRSFYKMFKDCFESKNIVHTIKYFFYLPGWSANGNSKTSKELQKELILKKD